MTHTPQGLSCATKTPVIFEKSQTSSMVVSIVSHGHGRMVQRLLHQIANASAATVRRVVVTQNVPEDDPMAPVNGWPFTLQLVRNAHIHGFGANHNKALREAGEDCVCVLNPDVQLLQPEPFEALLKAASGSQVGASYPVQVDLQGHIQTFEREMPDFWALFRRRVLGRKQRHTDWVNAACLVVPTAVWRASHGFDESYYMYCEDVDFCLRLRLMGLALVRAPAHVVHEGARASGRSVQHFMWHVRSLARLWRSPVYVQARDLVTVTNGEARKIADP